MRTGPKSITMLLLWIGAWGHGAQAHGPLKFNRVAVTNDPLPGIGSGYRFGGTLTPSMNERGAPVLPAGFSGPDGTQSGVLMRSRGEIRLMLEAGVPMPADPTDAVYLSTRRHAVQGRNRMVSLAYVEDPSGRGFDEAIVAGPIGRARVAARQGNPAPGVKFDFRGMETRPVTAANGMIAFVGQTGPSDLSDRGIWVGQPGNLEVAALRGEPAPGFDSSAAWHQIRTPVMSDSGKIAFHASTTAGAGIFTKRSDHPVEALVTTGQRPPGLPASWSFVEFNRGTSISPDGRLVFSAAAQRNDAVLPGLWAQGESNDVRRVFFANDDLPGAPTNARARFVAHPSMNTNGSIAFEAGFEYGGGITADNDAGIWVERNEQIQLVAREGEPAPGLQDDVFLKFGSGNPQSGLNSRDQIVFSTSLRGAGVNSDNDVALFGWDPAGGLMMIVRAGDLFDLAPNDHRTIEYIDFSSEHEVGRNQESGVGGGNRSLTDAGKVIFGLRFTDGTSGVFTTHIPAPSTLLPFAGISIAVAGRRRGSVAGAGA